MSSNESIDNKSNGGGVVAHSSSDPPSNAEALLTTLRTIKENEGATMVGTEKLKGILAEYVEMKSLVSKIIEGKYKLLVCSKLVMTLVF